MDQRIPLSDQFSRYWIDQDQKERKKLMDKDVLQLRAWRAAIVLMAVANLYFEYFGGETGVYLTKPFTMVLILLQPAVLGIGLVNAYQKTVLLGLMASVVGDVFLMVPGNYFVYGLGAFLVAHVLYAYAFFKDMEKPVNWVLAIPFLILGVLSFSILAIFGNLNGFLVYAIAVYAIAISSMAWLATSRMQELVNGRRELARFAVAGAVLFLISDSVLAYNRFVSSFEYAQLIVMATYFSAQYLISRSAILVRRKRF